MINAFNVFGKTYGTFDMVHHLIIDAVQVPGKVKHFFKMNKNLHPSL